MKATVLIDNKGTDLLPGEWGLSVYIRYDDRNILLDTGASGLFLKNAEVLGISVSDVDAAVLSHAHYDHGNGLDAFLAGNSKAPFYIRSAAGTDCYYKKWIFRRYLGLPQQGAWQYSDRIRRITERTEIFPGVTLLPHSTPGLSAVGIRESMYRKTPKGWIPDDFSHEQSLIFDTDKGLVIFNSCCHGGAGNIIREVAAAFPGKKVYGLIGGFHLFNKTEKEVRTLAAQIRETGISCLFTGHCTGDKAYSLLQEELGDRVHGLSAGLVMEF